MNIEYTPVIKNSITYKEGGVLQTYFKILYPKGLIFVICFWSK